MNSKAKLFCLCCASVGTFTLSAPTFAEVKSLTSSELTETYIKDSTIIVTPKKKKQQETQAQKVYSSLTIAPVENTDQDFDQLQQTQLHQDSTTVSIELNEDDLRNASIDATISPLEQVDIPTYQERTTLPVADILNDERYRVPEGDFELSYIGSQNSSDLGLSRVGDKLTFSIGAPADIPNPIVVPESVNEGPMQLIPRADGGFDLTIDIPQ